MVMMVIVMVINEEEWIIDTDQKAVRSHFDIAIDRSHASERL
jgi:hypothetical protein